MQIELDRPIAGTLYTNLFYFPFCSSRAKREFSKHFYVQKIKANLYFDLFLFFVWDAARNANKQFLCIQTKELFSSSVNFSRNVLCKFVIEWI